MHASSWNVEEGAYEAGIVTQDEIEIRSRADLRAWLAEHQDRDGSVWLVFWKKHTDHYVPFVDFVEECLCWGWVDSVTRGVDGDRSSVRISPRKVTSAWSAVNKDLVAKARASGAMTAFGEAKIDAGVANGMWSFLDDVERLEVPSDLRAALADRDAGPAWEAYPRSVKRGSLEWIKTAKTDRTRAARIAEVSGSAAEGQRPKPFRR
ncbi:MAG: YdeI/OmpD-associated family protein [Pseudomonadota bacterium]